MFAADDATHLSQQQRRVINSARCVSSILQLSMLHAYLRASVRPFGCEIDKKKKKTVVGRQLCRTAVCLSVCLFAS